MQYQTICAILYKGDRVEKGAIIELAVEEAAALGDCVVALGSVPVEPTPEPEKAIEEMNAAELKEKAAELGLSTTGTKADLQERITLHLEAAE